MEPMPSQRLSSIIRPRLSPSLQSRRLLPAVFQGVTLHGRHYKPGAEGTDTGKASPDNTSESAATPGDYSPVRTEVCSAKKYRAFASLNPGLLQHNARGHPEAKPGATGVISNGGRTGDATLPKTGTAVVSAEIIKAIREQGTAHLAAAGNPTAMASFINNPELSIYGLCRGY